MSASVRAEIHEAENLEFLRAQPDEAFDLVYLDPPFNTGRTRRHQTVRVERDEEGERVGFGDQRYRAVPDGPLRAYADAFDRLPVCLFPEDPRGARTPPKK